MSYLNDKIKKAEEKLKRLQAEKEHNEKMKVLNKGLGFQVRFVSEFDWEYPLIQLQIRSNPSIYGHVEFTPKDIPILIESLHRAWINYNDMSNM